MPTHHYSRNDAYAKVTGRAQFADDLYIDNQCYADIIHAAYPSATIQSIDTSAALAMDNVLAVITADDVIGALQVGNLVNDHYIFAKENVYYIGDAIAMVIATTKLDARIAKEKVVITYTEKSAITTPHDAITTTAPAIHPHLKPDNTVAAYRIRHGDQNPIAIAHTELIEETFCTNYVEHAYMEPESCIAAPEGDGSITVYGGMQHPFSTRRIVANALNLPLAKVRIKQTTLGGGFGGRDDTISIICARAAIAASIVNRPVKLTYTREQSILESYKRHPFSMTYAASMDESGQIQGLSVDLLADAGPYTAVSPFVIWRPTVQCTGPYHIPNVHCNSKAMYTNNPFTGAFRGFGTPQQIFANESFMDICAEKTGLNPYEFRKKHFFTQDSITHTGQQLNNHQVSIHEVTKKTLSTIDWEHKFKSCSRGKPDKNGDFHGIGFSCSYRGVSLGAEGNDFCSAILHIQQDGSILLESGVSENGQGLQSTMIHICATELGIAHSDITFLPTDTSSVPDGGPTVASRGTIMGGNAVINACQQIKQIMHPVLCEQLGNNADNFFYKNGQISHPINKNTIPFSDAVQLCYSKCTYLHTLGTFHAPSVNWDTTNGQGNAYFTYVYACHACNVIVSKDTGKIQVTNAVATHDLGKIINPQMAIGQVFGGMVMGLGFAIKENLIVDQGYIKTLNFNTYRIPSSMDMPEMTAHFIESDDAAGPWGAKSLGEPTNELMGAAIANAVYYATGIRFTSLPMDRHTVKDALAQR